MPQFDNTYAETFDGRDYGPSGVYDETAGAGPFIRCAVQDCHRLRFRDSLCAVHYYWRETVKPEIHFPELEGHRQIPGYFEILGDGFGDTFTGE